MRHMIRVLLVFGFAFPFYIFADDLFVTTDGSGVLCSKESPCLLSDALNGAADGDAIYMGEGNYTVASSPMITLDQNPIQLIGGWDKNSSSYSINVYPDKYVTVIDGDESYQCIKLGANSSVNLVGLTIANCRHDDNGSAVYGSGAERLQVENVNFINNIAAKEHATIYGGALFFKGDILSIEQSRFVDNTVKSHRSMAGALAVYYANTNITGTEFKGNNSWNYAVLHYEGLDRTSSHFTFNDNIVSENGLVSSASILMVMERVSVIMKRNSINRNFLLNSYTQNPLLFFPYCNLEFACNTIFNNQFGSAIVRIINGDYNIYNNIFAQNTTDKANVTTILSNSGSRLTHNTFADNNSTYAFEQDSSDLSEVQNNIFAHYETVIYTKDGSVEAKNNLFDDVVTVVYDDGGTTTEQNSTYGSARFLNAAAGDYHIRKNSDAQNRALATALSDDFDGDSRPQDSVADIGADEYTPGREPFGVPVLMYLLN